MSADTTNRMDMISDRLIELGMTRWLPVLHKWLRQYRGLEQHIDCQEDWPEYLVMECLDTYLASNTRPDSAELGDALSRLDFLTWRVRHEDGERWRPLEESYDKAWHESASAESSKIDRYYQLHQQFGDYTFAALHAVVN